MENEAVINTVMIWLFPSLMIIVAFFYKKDQKQKEVEMKEMKQEFRDFMKSQGEINTKNTKLITRLTTLQEVYANGK